MPEHSLGKAAENFEIDPRDALARQRDGALLLDVREDDERAAGMAEGAVGLRAELD